MHEVNYIWINYFWASLKGNGPEALVQTVVYGALAYSFVPAFRRFVNNHVRSIHVKLDAQHAEKMEQAERHHAEHLAAIRRYGEGKAPVAPAPSEPRKRAPRASVAPSKPTPARPRKSQP